MKVLLNVDTSEQPLVDTQQTIVVVKKELFQQQAATSLSETLHNTPGITLLLGSLLFPIFFMMFLIHS